MNKYVNKNIKYMYDNNHLSHYELTDIDRTLGEIHGQKYFDYRKEWNAASRMEKWEKPQYLIMETNSYCNMRCKMCIRNYDLSKNKAINVPLDTIMKIARDGREMGVPSFFIGAESECLINPNIIEIIKTIKDEGAGIDNFIISNGYELTDEIINLLIDIQWERLYISLDAAKSETYEKIRGKDLKHVEENIIRLLHAREMRQSMLPLVRVSFVIQEENRNEVQDFIDKWKDKVDIIDFQDLIHLEDMSIKDDISAPVDFQCVSPFRTLFIDCNGMIYPCCTEFAYKMPIGNISQMSIKDAWTSKFMVSLRKAMLEKSLPSVCKNCATAREHSDI